MSIVTEALASACYLPDQSMMGLGMAKPANAIVRLNLKIWLHDAEMSPAELARRLGISRSTISHWLSGQNDPTVAMCGRIAKIFDKPVSKLFQDPADPREGLPSKEEIFMHLGRLLFAEEPEKKTKK